MVQVWAVVTPHNALPHNVNGEHPFPPQCTTGGGLSHHHHHHTNTLPPSHPCKYCVQASLTPYQRHHRNKVQQVWGMSRKVVENSEHQHKRRTPLNSRSPRATVTGAHRIRRSVVAALPRRMRQTGATIESRSPPPHVATTFYGALLSAPPSYWHHRPPYMSSSSPQATDLLNTTTSGHRSQTPSPLSRRYTTTTRGIEGTRPVTTTLHSKTCCRCGRRSTLPPTVEDHYMPSVDRTTVIA
jgi:hypothetical protein